MVAAGRVREAYDKHVAEGFRHHNPNFAGDRHSLLVAMEENAVQNPDKKLDVKLAVAEGEHVAVLSHVRQSPQDRGGAAVHIFRFEDDRIVELWDVGQPLPDISPNKNGMF